MNQGALNSFSEDRCSENNNQDYKCSGLEQKLDFHLSDTVETKKVDNPIENILQEAHVSTFLNLNKGEQELTNNQDNTPIHIEHKFLKHNMELNEAVLNKLSYETPLQETTLSSDLFNSKIPQSIRTKSVCNRYTIQSLADKKFFQSSNKNDLDPYSPMLKSLDRQISPPHFKGDNKGIRRSNSVSRIVTTNEALVKLASTNLKVSSKVIKKLSDNNVSNRKSADVSLSLLNLASEEYQIPKTELTSRNSRFHYRPPSYSTTHRTEKTSVARQASSLRFREASYISSAKHTFENLTLDPSKYSSDALKRMAAATILRHLESKNKTKHILVADISRCDSISLYHSLVDTLLQQLGPMPYYDKLKFDDRIPKLYKDLGYPSILAKSHMISPCTLSTWPQHLVAMTWLACLLMFDAKVLMKLIDLSCFTKDTMYTMGFMPVHHTPQLYKIKFQCEKKFSEHSAQNTTFELNQATPTVTREAYQDEEPLSPTDAVLKTMKMVYIQYREQNRCLDQENINKAIEPAITNIHNRLIVEKREIESIYEEATAKWAAKEELVKEINNKQEILARLQKDKQIIEDTLQATKLKLKQEQQKTANLSALLEAKSAKVAYQMKELELIKEKIGKQEISRDESELLLRDIESKKHNIQEKTQERLVLEGKLHDLEIQTVAKQELIQTEIRTIAQEMQKLQMIIPIFTESLLPFIRKELQTDADINFDLFFFPLRLNITALTTHRLKVMKTGLQSLNENDITQFEAEIEKILLETIHVKWNEWFGKLTSNVEIQKSIFRKLQLHMQNSQSELKNVEELKKKKLRIKKKLLNDIQCSQQDKQHIKKKSLLTKTELHEHNEMLKATSQALNTDQELNDKFNMTKAQLERLHIKKKSLEDRITKLQCTQLNIKAECKLRIKKYLSFVGKSVADTSKQMHQINNDIKEILMQQRTSNDSLLPDLLRRKSITEYFHK